MKFTRRKLPLNALRAFEATGHHCHMRLAAEELGVTHAAISRQVRQLEETLEIKLFHRKSSRLTLTSAGQRLLEATSTGFDQITDGLLNLETEKMNGLLVWASTHSHITIWLMDVVGAFQQKYSDIESQLILIEPNTHSLPRNIDVAICHGNPEVDDRQSEVLFTEQYFPVCSPQLICPEQPVDHPENLLAYPLIRHPFDHWNEWFSMQNQILPKTKNVFNVVLGYQGIEAARKGLGVVLADKLEVAQDLRQGTLIRLLEEAAYAEESQYLVYPHGEQLPLRTRVFIQWIKRAVKKLRSS